MRNSIFSPRAKMMAATLCGAGVLAIGGLSLDRAEAQNTAEEMADEPRTQQNDIAKVQQTGENPPVDAPRLDLGQTEFDVELVRDLGAEMALVTAQDREFLVPQLALVSRAEQAEVNEEPLSVDAESERAQELESERAQELEDGRVHSSAWEPGDDLRFEMALENVELLAHENELLTLRTASDDIVQVPTGALADERIQEMVVRFGDSDSEMQEHSLSQIIEEERQLAFFETLSSDLPTVGAVGVILSTEGDRTVLASIGNDEIELLEVPPALQAGQAVTWRTLEDSRLDFDPLGAAPMMVEYEEFVMNGRLMSKADGTIVLENGESMLIVPSELTLRTGGEERSLTELELGTDVAVTVPEGRSEVLVALGETVVVKTAAGAVQIPREQLEGNLVSGDLELDEMRSQAVELEHLNSDQSWEGVVLGRDEAVLLARIEGDSVTVVAVPQSLFPEDLREGQRVEIDSEGREITVLNSSNFKATAQENEN